MYNSYKGPGWNKGKTWSSPLDSYNSTNSKSCFQEDTVISRWMKAFSETGKYDDIRG